MEELKELGLGSSEPIPKDTVLDTYGADALLEQVSLHISCDTAGSRQIYIK